MLRGLLVGAAISLLAAPVLADSELPEISFSQSAYSTTEGGTITMVVEKDGDGATSVKYESYDTGTPAATAGSDYQSVSGQLDFASDDTEMTITVKTHTDAVFDEQSELFAVRLSLVSGSDGEDTATLVIPSTGVGVILNCTTSC